MPENTKELRTLRAELETIAAREKALASEENEFEGETAAMVNRIEEFESRAQRIREHEKHILTQRGQFEEELRKAADFSSPALEEVIRKKTTALMAFEEQLGQRDKSLRREEAELYRRRHAIIKKPVGLSRPKKRLKTGIQRLDEILMGGIPQRSNVLLSGLPLLGHDLELFAYLFLLEGMKNSTPGMFVLFDKSAAAVRKALNSLSPEISEFEENEVLKVIDYSTVDPGSTVNTGDIIPSAIIDAITDALQAYKRGTEIRIVVDSLSNIDSKSVGTKPVQFLRDLRLALYHYHYTSLFLFTALKYASSEIQSLRHFMDGEIKFKIDNDQTALMVKGLEATQSLRWLEYKQISGTIEIGSGESGIGNRQDRVA